ncbi:hypothetical protein EIP91_001872 [Steccherinum ochraceum]|uniref:Uncharacterized protein n=1 Tax=Steccherinum ochraceum TaxID=92696 RepID=A0A4R0RTY4_9APHY|nr:hypothetical protein EIP91_001872 [Steccherinum ochraceum]
MVNIGEWISNERRGLNPQREPEGEDRPEDIPPALWNLLQDPTIPFFLRNELHPHYFYIDPREILRVLAQRRVEDTLWRAKRDYKRAEGEVVTPSTTPKRWREEYSPSDAEGWYNWSKYSEMDQDKGERAAFEYAKSRTQRLLASLKDRDSPQGSQSSATQDEVKNEPNDETISELTMLEEAAGGGRTSVKRPHEDSPGPHTAGRVGNALRRHWFSTPSKRRRSQSPRYVPETPSPQRLASVTPMLLEAKQYSPSPSSSRFPKATPEEIEVQAPPETQTGSESPVISRTPLLSNVFRTSDPIVYNRDELSLHSASQDTLVRVPLDVLEDLLASRRENKVLRESLGLEKEKEGNLKKNAD